MNSWVTNNSFTIWINDKKVNYNSNLKYLNRNEIAYFSEEKVDLKFENYNKTNNNYYLYTRAFFEKHKLWKYPQKYHQKVFKTVWVKSDPDELRKWQDKNQKEIEKNKIKSLNTKIMLTANNLNKTTLKKI